MTRSGPVAHSGLNPFAFLVGCPRSGTTLFKRMVTAHPEVVGLPEVPWLATAPGDPRWVDPDGTVLPAFFGRLAERGSLGRYARLPVPTEELVALASGQQRVAFRDLVGLLLDRFAAQHGVRLVVNKTVDSVLHVAALGASYPDAKVVHLIRDGRDVVSSARSWRRAHRLAGEFTSWHREPVGTAALWWEWHVRRGIEGGAELGPRRYLEVRYETLVSAPEATLAAVCDFLGLAYSDAMLRFNEGRERTGPGLDAKHAWRPPTLQVRDWRREMSTDDLESFEAVAGGLLGELGYADAGVAPAAAARHCAELLRASFEGRPLPRCWGLPALGGVGA